MFFKKILILSLLCTTTGLCGAVHASVCKVEAFAPGLLEEIVQAFRDCNARVIGQYFNSSVELIFSESSGVYSKAQAEQILKTFFNNNASASGKFNYTHSHGSERGNVQYHIGELQTDKGSYRVNIQIKDQRIHYMRIETND